MQLVLPKQVKKIIEVLEGHGYEAFAVGGCVRDSLLGRTPDDWDITTSAKPQVVKELFPRTVDTGLQHGTVTVLMDRVGYEVTTYRLDGEYEDGRHPREVTFTDNLIEDLKRRDFTINAMAYSASAGLVDAFDGAGDLKQGVIRCVGDASCRFEEDALRILRAVRFSAQLGFVIEQETRKAIRNLAGNLKRISAERIQTELVKLLNSPHPDYLRQAWELGITSVILPEFDAAMETPQNNPHHRYSVGEHTLAALGEVPEEKALRLTMLFHDLGKPLVRTTDRDGIDHFYGHARVGAELAKQILKRLKFDNATIKKTVKLVEYHGIRPKPREESVRKLASKLGRELYPQLLQVQRADACAKAPDTKREQLERLAQICRIYQGILERKECLTLKELAVCGADLIGDGMKPGPEIGQVLAQLLEHVLEVPEHNTREYLLEYSKALR